MDYLRKDLGLLVDGEKRWHQVLGKIGLDMQHYILNALKRGDNVKNPRIKLSTIHSIKGGEDDNILLIPDISYAAYKEYERNPSIEHRVFYVGVTRAKKNLHIMQPQTERFYNI
jgi:superfamily I DNA/RNA helicase